MKKNMDEIYEFLTYGPQGFKIAQNKWIIYETLMNIKRKTGYHLLAANGKPLIYEIFPEIPEKWRIK